MRWFGLFLAMCVSGAQAGVIGAELAQAMARRGTHADTAVIVRLANPLNIEPMVVTDRRKRSGRMFTALKERAANNLEAIRPLLASLDAQRVKDLWMIDAVALSVPAVAVKQLADHPGVVRVDLDSFVQGARSQRTPLSRTPSVFDQPLPPEKSDIDAVSSPRHLPTPDWNVAAVRADALWREDYYGKGVVVATMDTGVDLAHPALRRQWRGGSNSWFDPHGEQPTPSDAIGHGTQALGVILGGGGLGVAPDAKWIAVRMFNAAGRASMSDIHLAFQWLLDPDEDPLTLDAPDVVNASWALTGRSGGACVMEFSEDIRTLKAAGIAVVFAAGNDGPGAGTSNSPGNNPNVLSVGAMDRDFEIARQTSRGPSACDGSVFPKLLAPGIGIRTADLSHGGEASFTTVSGSSMAAPHASGVLALLAGAVPSASVTELEAALLSGLQPARVAASGTKAALSGRLDALAALNALRASHDTVSAGAVPALPTR